MFARFLGRESTPKPTKEETPEQDSDVNNNASVVKQEHEGGNENNNQTVKKQQSEPATDLDDIKVDITSAAETTKKAQKSPSGWIYAYDKKSIWPENLEASFPAQLRRSIASRTIAGRELEGKWNQAKKNREDFLDQRSGRLHQRNSRIKQLSLERQSAKGSGRELEIKMNQAKKRRDVFLDQRKSRSKQHNAHAKHLQLVHKDFLKLVKRTQAIKTNKKIEEAQARRENILGEKRFSANDSITPKSSISEELYESYDTPQRRMESAVQFRSLYLKAVSHAAGKSVEHARLVAAEVSSAEKEASAIIEEMLEQRLQRAAVRRSIVLDRRRLAAGRHGNYVKSVYLTNRYMDRRSAQMIQHNLDAAAFRRDVKLEEIKSNVRQQNLSAQFRSCVAYRVWDAKWLNCALKTTAAQTAAKIRRDMQHEVLQERLQAAERRREDVKAAHRLIVSNSMDLDELNERMENATYRREMFLFERRAVIQERRNIIRGRKSALQARTRKVARKALENKLNMAKMRRDAFLESRRSICATRNWHAKICANRHEEQVWEDAAARLSEYDDRLKAAEARRLEYQEPIFAALVSLRLARAYQIRLAREYIEKRVAERKDSFAKLRISALNQLTLNKVFERLSRVKRVQSNRQFMETFYKQVIANTTTARQRGAELRRSLHQDAIKAAATETIERSAAARERVAYREEEARELLQMKIEADQNTADARRLEARQERIGTALWFQGKLALARNRMKENNEAQRDLVDESVSIANLRRSIRLTKGLQKSVDRKVRWNKRQKKINQEREEQRVFQDIKAQKADARRNAALLRKIEVARTASSRVTVVRLEKRAEDVVDAAIRTAISKTMSKNAEDRRQEHLEDIQCYAAQQVNHAKGVARSQKELQQVRAEIILQQCHLRMLRTSKRRENLMSQRKLGQSTIEQLQPYAGLTVIGHAVPLSTSA